MPKPNPFEGSNSSPPKYSIEELQQKYFYLTKTYGAALWDTSDGKELESFLEREDLFIETGDYIFAAPRTITMYWDIVDHLNFGEKQFLLIGEPGTGKEAIANIISNHTKKKLVAVNCATLVDSLADSLLFGISEKSGLPNIPRKGTPGFVENADGQVLFLDEFFDAQPSVLPKLLRLLQEPRVYHRVGDANEQTLAEDTIIVAASNRYPTLKSLRQAIRTNQVRPDLIERFVSQVEVPSLQQRKKEIPRIANNLLKRIGCRSRKDNYIIPCSLSENAANTLRFHDHAWPGNVRELFHLLTSQARLHSRTEGGDQLDVPRHAIDALREGRMDLTHDVTQSTISSLETVALSAWSKTETVRLRERQLVAQLYLNMMNEGRNQVDERWVSEQCKSVLQTGNPSQRLQDGIRQNCKQIAQKVNGLYQLG